MENSVITMILKPDKIPSLPGSYRPISLLPVIGKLLEGILTVRITQYMIRNKLINEYQCGFRKGKSCEHQLIRLAEYISTWMNKRPSGRTVAIFVDAEKAFDSLWHCGLKKMLLDAKIPVNIVRWLSSFLDGRIGCIKVNSTLSKVFKIILSYKKKRAILTVCAK